MTNAWPRTLGTLLMVFAGSTPVWSQATGQATQLPNTPAEGQFRAWLSAFNQGDRTALLKFFNDNYPSEVGRIDGDLNFRARTGGFDFRKAESATATQYTGLVQERGSDQFARAVVTVEPNEPHHILSLGRRAIPRPPEFAIPRLTEAELVTQLGSKLNEDAKKGLFSGTVLVAHQGKSVFSGAYGLANRDDDSAGRRGAELDRYFAGSRAEIQLLSLCAPLSLLASATTTYPV